MLSEPGLLCKRTLLLWVGGHKVVISALINTCHFRAPFVSPSELPSCSAPVEAFSQSWLNGGLPMTVPIPLALLRSGGSHSPVTDVCVDLEHSIMPEFLMCCLCGSDTLSILAVFRLSTGAVVRKGGGVCFPPLEKVHSRLQH